MGRALVATRLSHDTDESTSIVRQTEAGRKMADLRGDTVVKVTEDVDVSGSVSPFNRADLGPWLTDPAKVRQWDVIIVAKLDRLSRSMRDFDDFRVWCDQHGKKIVSVSENLDLSSAIGRMFAGLLAMFAQFERERMSERQLDAKRKDRSMGVWGGGKPGYGLTTVKRDSKHYLAVDESQALVINRMAADIIGGKSARSIAVALNTEGVPAHRGGTWDASQVLAVLRNHTLRGYMTHKDELVRDAEGLPVRHDAVVITPEVWGKLESLLSRNSAERQSSEDAPLLRGVLSHLGCGQELYIQRRDRGDRYRHQDQTRKACPCESGGSWVTHNVDAAVVTALLAYVGSWERCEMKTVGEDHRPEIQRLEESLAAWQAKAIEGEATEAVFPILKGLQVKLDRLRAMPLPTEVPVSTGQTFAAYWESLTEPQRNGWLRELGVKVLVRKDEPFTDEAHVRLAQELPADVSTVARIPNGQLLIWFGELSKLVSMAQAA